MSPTDFVNSVDAVKTKTGTVITVSFTDRNKEVARAGAQAVINLDLYQGGKKAGHVSLTCIADSRHQFLCSGVNTLPGGQIATSEVVPANDPFNAPGAITGGTGKYRDASGQLRTTPINGKDSNLARHAMT